MLAKPLAANGYKCAIMRVMNEHQTKILRSVLPVAAQFVLILLLLLPPSEAIIHSPAGLIVLSCGACMALWTLVHNRVGNFNVFPDPKIGGKLITNGPYRFIRHPMYVSVLLTMAGFAFSTEAPLRVLYWVLLLAVLWLKSQIEEKMLEQKFPDYVAYKRTAGRFFPRFFVSQK